MMFHPLMIPDLPQVTGMTVRYEVHLISNGRKGIGFPQGTPFIPSGLHEDFSTIDAANAALNAYRAKPMDKYHYPYLPARIVQVVSVATIIQEVE